MSKTACIVPWSTLAIWPDGRTNFCCDIAEPLTVDGRPGSVYRDSLDDLWNATELVQVRAAMARGEKPEICHTCWEREAAGGVSRRLTFNETYRHLGGRRAIETLPLDGAESGYHLTHRPDWFILELGNVCDLKCRSCSSLSSSRIAADPVHHAWNADHMAPPREAASAPRLQLAPEDTSAWFKDIDAVTDMIASGARGNAILSLMGGETFLIDSTWRLLNALVERGIAPHIIVGLVTNGQHRNASVEKLAPRFRGFNVSLSIDGHGKLYDYLRHGASWRTLVDNLSWLREVPNLSLTAIPTLQNCNVLDMVTLLRFLDEHELTLAYNLLTWPERLRPANLPPNVRRIAAARLRGYLDEECRPINVAIVRNYCEILEEAGESFDAGLFAEFMTFTNDLDASRGESLAEAAPELMALIRAGGVEWSQDRRHVPSSGVRPAFQQAGVLQRVNRTVSSQDAIFGGFEAARTGAYFSSGLNQLAEIEALLREQGHPGLAGSRAIADFACHYGRMTRALRAALPHTAVYACDIDRDAVNFCAVQLGALPVLTGWKPDEDSLPGDLDAVVCISLLTHTPLEHWRCVLRAWARMLRPGGIAAFTFLSEKYLDGWVAGAMEHYGDYPPELRAATVRSVLFEGHGFAALTSDYGGEPFYGIAFATADVVRREIRAAGLDLLALPAEENPGFAQDLALVRRPCEQDVPRAETPAVQRDVSVVALYDPRCYAPAAREEGNHLDSVWTRLTSACPQPPLPTELGFGDPRVPEVREVQAALAREHAIDAFCYLYPWTASGPRWDAPWRDLLTTGRPDFSFCLMVSIEDDEPIAKDAAGRLLDDIADGLRDPRYLRVGDRMLVIVRDVARLGEPQAIAASWRAGAAARGLGELHLCAVERSHVERPEVLGFDSFLEARSAAADRAGVVAAALTRPWPAHRFFRRVECRRDADPRSVELYEHWLRSAVDETRRRGEALIFIDAWNDWLRGLYLEPDDRDGRAALLATRRAARGPASGLVLLRQLRDSLGNVEGRTEAVLGELEQVLALHEHTRDRLLASVEVALGRNQKIGPEESRWVPVACRQLLPSGGSFCLDRVGGVSGAELQTAPEPIPMLRGEVNIAGWAHTGTCAPEEVDLFLALESCCGTPDHIVPVTGRLERQDVLAAFPGYPLNCGFDANIDFSGVAPGEYVIAIVQRTPLATYRDASGVAVRLAGEPCSSA